MSIDVLTSVFRDVFDDSTIILTPELSARDVPNWDSFNHINLVVGIEEAFNVSFTTEEIAGMQNIGDLVNVLQAKGCAVEWK